MHTAIHNATTTNFCVRDDRKETRIELLRHRACVLFFVRLPGYVCSMLGTKPCARKESEGGKGTVLSRASLPPLSLSRMQPPFTGSFIRCTPPSCSSTTYYVPRQELSPDPPPRRRRSLRKGAFSLKSSFGPPFSLSPAHSRSLSLPLARFSLRSSFLLRPQFERRRGPGKSWGFHSGLAASVVRSAAASQRSRPKEKKTR